MQSKDASQNFVSARDFSNHTERWIQRAGETHQPVVITQGGQPLGVLLSPVEFDHLVQHKHLLQDMASAFDEAEPAMIMPELLKRLGLDSGATR